MKEKSFDSDENGSLLSPGLHHSLVVSNFGKLHLHLHLLPYKNTELAHAAVIRLGLVSLLVVVY